MPVFSIVLDTFKITQTRSAHADTGYVSVTLLIGGGKATQSVCKPMGSLNNGTFTPGVGFPAIDVPEGAPVVINYLIINSSARDSLVETRSAGARDTHSHHLCGVPTAAGLLPGANSDHICSGDRHHYQTPFLRRSGCSRTELPYLRAASKLCQPSAVLFANDFARWHQGSKAIAIRISRPMLLPGPSWGSPPSHPM